MSADGPLNDSLSSTLEKMRPILSGVGEFIIVTDEFGAIRLMNPASERMTGWQDTEAGKISFTDLLQAPVGSAHPHSADILEQIVNKGRPVSVADDCLLVSRTGESIPITGSGSPIHEESGKVIGVIFILRDRTAEREAGRRLAESEANYRNLVEMSPDALLIYQDDKIAFINSSGAKLVGAGSPESMIGESIVGFMHPNNLKASREREGRLLSGESVVYPVEGEYLRLDGTVVPVEITAGPTSYNGRPAIQIVVREITERKTREQALRESEALFRSIYEGSPIAINNVDRYGFAFKCNRAMESLLGYSADELSRMHFNDFTHPDDRDIGPDMIHELRSGPDDIVKFDKRYVKKNGEIICAHLTVSAVRDEAGTVMYYIAIVEDITEWWNAQETIRRSEERYRSLVDNARDTIFTLSSNAVLLSLNQAFETMTGWKREDWIGKSYVELIHPEDRQKAAGTFRKTLDGELSGVMQYRVLTKGGEYRTGEFSSTRLVLEDGSPGVLGIARDVTAQIAVEDELRQAQKMESIGNLAGGIAHDFNNILGIIIGYSSLTLRSLKNNEKLSHNIELIAAAAKRGADLSRQLLALARREVISPKPVNINSAVASIKKCWSR